MLVHFLNVVGVPRTFVFETCNEVAGMLHISVEIILEMNGYFTCIDFVVAWLLLVDQTEHACFGEEKYFFASVFTAQYTLFSELFEGVCSKSETGYCSMKTVQNDLVISEHTEIKEIGTCYCSIHQLSFLRVVSNLVLLVV